MISISKKCVKEGKRYILHSEGEIRVGEEMGIWGWGRHGDRGGGWGIWGWGEGDMGKANMGMGHIRDSGGLCN